MFENSLSKNQLLLLYEQGKSMADIALLMQCSIHKVVYWMDKYDLQREIIVKFPI